MIADTGIIYAFIATVAGCLISLAAGVIAATRARSLATDAQTASPKPEHVRVPRRTLPGTHLRKRRLSARSEYAQVQVSLMVFEQTLVAAGHKPTPWINRQISFPNKSSIRNRRLSACPCG